MGNNVKKYTKNRLCVLHAKREFFNGAPLANRAKHAMRVKRTLPFVFSVLLLCGLVLSGCEKKSEIIIPDDTAYAKDSGADTAQNAASGVSSSETVHTDALGGTDTGADGNSTLFVHVCGAVLNEGLYELDEGARIADAVNAAGGFSSEADSTYLNLAEHLLDGMKVFVPTVEETQSSSFASNALKEPAEEDDGLVNINTATAAELCTLSGIGEKKAADIIAYREANGAFSSVEELMNVSGIGEKMFQKIKDFIKV